MAYERVNWENLPSTNTPVNADNLNKMDEGIANAVEKSDLLNLIYPVGSIYMSVNSTNPATLFGGTWVAWGSGRVPVGVNSNDIDFNRVEKTGGEKAHQLTIEEMPSHNHSIKKQVDNNSGNKVSAGSGSSYLFYQLDDTAETNNTGGSQAHNNMQPYITCYMWKRIA